MGFKRVDENFDPRFLKLGRSDMESDEVPVRRIHDTDLQTRTSGDLLVLFADTFHSFSYFQSTYRQDKDEYVS